MKNKLNWGVPEARRRKLRLKIFYAIFDNQARMDATDYFKSAFYASERNDHILKYGSTAPGRTFLLILFSLTH